MKNRIRIIVLVIIVVMLNVGCDQSKKDYARKNIRDQGTINVIGSFFVLRYMENNGAFLSLGSKMLKQYKTILLVFFPIIIVVSSLIYLIFSRTLSIFQIICISCIIGGGIGNIFDRITNTRLWPFLLIAM